MIEFERLFKVLVAGGVEFIVAGGTAAAIHGSSRLTNDLDIVYRRSPENLCQIVEAIGPLEPYLRGAPAGLPFAFNERTLRAGLNFTLTTSLGWLDLLGEITGGGSYDDLLPHTIAVNVYDVTIRCLDLDTLIRVKHAAGRPKDFEVIAELEVIRERRR